MDEHVRKRLDSLVVSGDKNLIDPSSAAPRTPQRESRLHDPIFSRLARNGQPNQPTRLRCVRAPPDPPVAESQHAKSYRSPSESKGIVEPLRPLHDFQLELSDYFRIANLVHASHYTSSPIQVPP